VLVLTGCASTLPGGHRTGPPAALRSSSARTASSLEGTPAASGGCSASRLAAGLHRRSLRAGGVRRTYLLEVPRSVPGRRLPLVLDLHGYDESAAEQDAYTGLSAAAARRGVYVVTPDGYQHRWNFVRRPAVGPDDVRFLTTLLSALTSVVCYDPHDVVVTGFSDGADMANVLGCARPGRLAAVFAVAPSIVPRPCRRTPPTMIEVHGTADPVVPFAGGGGDRPFPFQGTEAVAAATRMNVWARLNSCSTPVSSMVAAGVSMTRWHCPRGRIVALYAIDGGGHTWPGASPRPEFGATNEAVSATRAVLSLAVHPGRLPWRG
jgi:polyhydroxybutyrate depolymerase